MRTERSELARRLQAARIEAGYDNTDALAPLIGKDARQLRNYESGFTKKVPVEVIKAWAIATKKPLEYFIPTGRSEEQVTTPTQVHPGVEELALPENAALRSSLGLTDELMSAMRAWYVATPQGKPVTIDTLAEAIAFAQAILPAYQRSLRRGR